MDTMSNFEPENGKNYFLFSKNLGCPRKLSMIANQNREKWARESWNKILKETAIFTNGIWLSWEKHETNMTWLRHVAMLTSMSGL